MRLTDLELYRWKFHNDIYIHTIKSWCPGNYPGSSWFQYWKEHGAFISVLPRQSGKSQMIVTMINSLPKENYVIICAYRQANVSFRQAGFDRRKTFNGKSIKVRDIRLVGLN
ncbi:hypothetical protein LCGC14_2443240, partial [marine sediment metagenome]